MVYFILFFVGLIVTYYIMKDEFSDSPKLNYNVQSSFDKTMISILLYFTISIIVIMFFIFYWDKIIIHFFHDYKYINEMVDSGLCFAFMIPLTGVIIQVIYNMFYWIDKNKKYICLLYPDENKWIIIIACLSLIFVGLLTKEFRIVFSAAALIVGKFLWFETLYNRDEDKKYVLAKEIKSIINLPIFTLFIIGLFMFVVISCYINEDKAFFYTMSLCIGLIAGIIFFAYKNRKN